MTNLRNSLSPTDPLATVRGCDKQKLDSRSPILNLQNRKAFEILVRENSRMLLVYLRSLVRDEASVDDLFQESMVVAWRRLNECDLDQPFGPWLKGIASRLVLAHYLRLNVDPVVLQEAVLNVVDRHFENINLLAGDTWNDKIAALHDCIENLPEKQMAGATSGYSISQYLRSPIPVADRYEIELGDLKVDTGKGKAFSQLIGRRKSRDVRGPKQVEIGSIRRAGLSTKCCLMD